MAAAAEKVAYGPEDEAREVEEELDDSKFDVTDQRRRQSYLEYFGLAETPAEDQEAGAGGLSLPNTGHRKSSAVSILFDAGKFTHWTDLYRQCRGCQPVLFKKMPLRVEVLQPGQAPSVLGSREMWIAVHAHGKACYGPAPCACDDWPMDCRLAIVKKPMNELVYQLPNGNSTETAKVYSIYTDVNGDKYIRLSQPDANDFFDKAP
ncbi:hypothetical protein TGPRC2_314070 [Toxoplasma gondii TgCatPRC2]|uniref:Uncharacterized protein n=6 Tax=Toxoplasma gondii TaxID=5811 RepID=B6K993_TOXGV|nr:hypothetical protein TGME49_314070 [Toxoplasma gondii ME49]ESS35203.1 hypothetical protein TGVEG_314070 [Toxoplasma gondii VEG]KFG37607.1 hypothetical protein TGDOM2_314070 [Toxoplasma gondii GAB2-2007-GAL-DOM2]KYF48576.1 hypothetical protein TGARI_314070 [Toxoplasma gondii ARI]KYK65412.1 hypothetical protein TGPRC2_314070 [Toxoplasma gondii TgCatPRC2]PIM00666.1 hypothetical protein TGCOUG_314070 [Toxoplasma gondii COUG]|eukprot:XP_002364617.1 hypothetical protein TGME49_314070 [Toxoplasma gondii ME49]